MNEGANLFRRDWSRTPAGDTFVDLVFNEWWTDETITSSTDGIADIRAFKGMYEIVYEANGEMIRDTINLTEDTNLEIIANNISTRINDLLVDHTLAKVYPNPADSQLIIEKHTTLPAIIQVFDMTGRKIIEQQTTDLKTRLAVSDLEGIYIVKESDGIRTTSKKITVQ